MKRKQALLLILLMAILLVAFPGCRSQDVVEEEPTPAPAPPPAPIVEEQPDIIEEPDDFVTEEPEPVETEDLTGDISEINRRAQERGWIRDAFFAYDASTLSAEAQDNLAISAAWLKGHPEFNLLIEGHCDERGTEQYNLALGERRANTAKDYLETLGIGEGRIRTISYGEERPFATGSNESAWAKNRRAHLVLLRR